MQHFGAPTRLLDFTRSAYVAAYFALEDRGESDSCAVLAIDRTWCAEAAGNVLAADGLNHALIEQVKQFMDTPQEIALGLSHTVGRDEKTFATAILSRNPTLVIPIEPERLSERLSVQQGTFLCTGNAERSFMDNLTALAGWEGAVRKFIIPFRVRGLALEQLRKMNITRASLFPGLDGFAQSFRNSLERESPALRALRTAINGLDLGLNKDATKDN